MGGGAGGSSLGASSSAGCFGFTPPVWGARLRKNSSSRSRAWSGCPDGSFSLPVAKVAARFVVRGNDGTPGTPRESLRCGSDAETRERDLSGGRAASLTLRTAQQTPWRKKFCSAQLATLRAGATSPADERTAPEDGVCITSSPLFRDFSLLQCVTDKQILEFRNLTGTKTRCTRLAKLKHIPILLNASRATRSSGSDAIRCHSAATRPSVRAPYQRDLPRYFAPVR